MYIIHTVFTPSLRSGAHAHMAVKTIARFTRSRPSPRHARPRPSASWLRPTIETQRGGRRRPAPRRAAGRALWTAARLLGRRRAARASRPPGPSSRQSIGRLPRPSPEGGVPTAAPRRRRSMQRFGRLPRMDSAWRDLSSIFLLSRLISLAPCAASARDPQSTSHTYVSPRLQRPRARRRRPVCAAPRSRFDVFTCARATAPPPQKLNQPRLSSDHLLVSSPERPRAVATPMHTRCVHGAHCCSRSCSLLTLPSSLLCSLALWGSCPHGWSSKTPQDVSTSRARTRA